MLRKYDNQIYDMYLEEVEKNKKLTLENKKLKSEVANLKYELKQMEKKVDDFEKLIDKAVNNAVAKVTEKYEKKIDELNAIIKNQADEIDRLKNRVNKNSTNSSKPSSTEFVSPKKQEETKSSANQYNYRTPSKRKSGAQLGHIGHSLSKDKIEKDIKEKNVETQEFIHYINGDKNENDIIKYRLGMKVITYVEKHIFKHTPKTNDVLPKEFYTDVTYDKYIKALCVHLGFYNVISVNRLSDLFSVLTNGVITLSEGFIDNVYKDFSVKANPSLKNIEDNLLDEKSMKTDEITSKLNGKNAFFRGYGNSTNALYKAHEHKGHTPIKEDNILTRYFGVIIGDHDTTLYSYGSDNAECNIHVGRYFEELIQNIYEIYWSCEMKTFLFRLNNTKKIAMEYGLKELPEYKIQEYEQEYDRILERALLENEEISSTYYKKKAKKLANRLKKYKHNHLLFIKDFDIDFDNNAEERDLRMIRNKTKIAGCFRSIEGAKCFADGMSIIKTSIKRGINPFDSILNIFDGQVLFA